VELQVADRRDWRPAGAAALVTALLVVVFLAVFTHLWYGVHFISDVPVYEQYAVNMASGMLPYRDFPVEYPPLAIPLFWLPWYPGSPATYATWFAVEMFALTALSGVVVCAAASWLWPRGRMPYAAAALFAATAAATGAIVENRYDAAVALVVAALLLFLVKRRYVAAAVTIGFGFALKLTPIALLPLVLILIGRRQKSIRATIACGVVALVPFLPYLIVAPGGIWHVFQYHLKRPLQIESVLGTPFLVGKALGRTTVAVGYSHVSHEIIAHGAWAVAVLSGPITLLAVGGVLWLLYRRRRFLRATPRALPTALYAVLLALMVGSKVLSPQYFVWLLPVIVLVTIDDLVLGVLSLAVLALTQIEFPAWYGRLIMLQTEPLWIVAARNLLLVCVFGLALWRVARLPTGRSASPANRLGAPVSAAARSNRMS
jgi:hypothetical protein